MLRTLQIPLVHEDSEKYRDNGMVIDDKEFQANCCCYVLSFCLLFVGTFPRLNDSREYIRV